MYTKLNYVRQIIIHNLFFCRDSSFYIIWVNFLLIVLTMI